MMILTLFHLSWLQLKATTWKLTGSPFTLSASSSAFFLCSWRKICLFCCSLFLHPHFSGIPRYSSLTKTCGWRFWILRLLLLWLASGWCLFGGFSGTFKFIDQLEYLSDIDFSWIIFIEYLKNWLILLFIYVEIIEGWIRWRGVLATSSCIHC